MFILMRVGGGDKRTFYLKNLSPALHRAKLGESQRHNFIRLQI